ncbi:DUF883 family protein [Devosia nitrariae]|uniref:ElaB/YqjD/DUF883 family membrane-anchored ribosome-binding protein n=1 Tax=Devosia nitrariae TaxID=2071872 RepID=A0ABQ5W7I5_9HYPH|nr:DNA gyrase subunit B [Devosia nitrariae]GLQ55736.1 hypothetical protein GCM10010862_29950 [Devosia nitrariae]
MADATTGPAAGRAKSGNGTPRTTGSKQQSLEEQIGQLQADLKSIADTLARLSGDKVSEARDTATGEVRHLQRQAQHLLEDVQGQAGEFQTELKSTIREKPLTAMASAIGIGFLLALLTRR